MGTSCGHFLQPRPPQPDTHEGKGDFSFCLVFMGGPQVQLCFSLGGQSLEHLVSKQKSQPAGADPREKMKSAPSLAEWM